MLPPFAVARVRSTAIWRVLAEARAKGDFTADTPWLNTALGVVLLLGRFVPIVFVLALAGSLAATFAFTLWLGRRLAVRPELTELVAAVMADEDTLLIISSDLSHFLTQDEAVAVEPARRLE